VSLNFFERLIRNELLHHRFLRRLLFSSGSANLSKVELLVAIQDRARAPHERKADQLVKSKLKRPAVRSSGSLAAST